VDVIALDQAMNRLARLDARQCQIVELRFFGGLSEGEIADVLHISTRTVIREWRTARALLYAELRGAAHEPEVPADRLTGTPDQQDS
jgi:DNA-directed RNA polymerase specialized sigma24 family protein